MKTIVRHSAFCFLLFVLASLHAQTSPETFHNPILQGFNPDPSICRVGEDYYLVTSSFTWFPGLPIYHSRDLVNWELIGHGISRSEVLNFAGVNENDGIWAPTIRYHNGLFYIITTAYKSGGIFYITAIDPKGHWSDPVWLKDAPGIDPSLFWDDNGKCYYTGNCWDFKKSWPGQVAIWLQELDLKRQKLVGRRKTLTYGHAADARYAESPHIYKINGQYLLLMAEGGSGLNRYHAVTAHHSHTLFGDYMPDQINPVLTHRHLGKDYPIQNIGHTDLVQIQNGEWYAVVLGNRIINEQSPLGRETFLCKVDFENGTPIFNAGYGKVLDEQPRPNLPWVPVKEEPQRDEFDGEKPALKWYCVRTPQKQFYFMEKGQLNILLQPEVIDSSTAPAILVQKIKHHKYTATTKLSFFTQKDNEQAGMVVYRTANGYYSLMKGKSEIVLTKKYLGEKQVVAQVPYNKKEVYLSATASGLDIDFSFGETPRTMQNIGDTQSLDAVSDNPFNKFNGTGIGIYATGNGKPSENNALYDWFEYKSD